MDECNLRCRNAALDQHPLDVRVEVYAFGVLAGLHIGVRFHVRRAFRRRHIAENHLRALDFLGGFVFFRHALYAGDQLASVLIGQARINHALGVTQFAAFAGNFQHVVLFGVNMAFLQSVRALRQLVDVVQLELPRFALYGNALAAAHLRHFQPFYTGLYVRKAAEQALQFRQVLETGEGLLLAEALAAGRRLHHGHHFTKQIRPGVKAMDAQLLQCIFLQIFLHDVHFAHAVHHGRRGGKYDAAPAVQAAQIFGFHVHIKGALAAVAVAQARYVIHVAGEKQVFVFVRFVHKDAVNAHVFKVDIIRVTSFCFQLLQLHFQALFRLLHVLHAAGLLAVVPLLLLYRSGDLVNGVLIEGFFVFRRHGNMAVLFAAHNHRVIVAGGNTVCKLLPILGVKIVLAQHQNLGRGEEVQKFTAPLAHKGLGHHEHRLLHDTQLPQLHGCAGHLCCLARAYAMGDQRIAAALHNAVHHVLLMGAQLFICVRAGNGQGAAVIVRRYDGIIAIIIQFFQAARAFLICPKPLREALLDFLGLFAGCLRGVAVQHAPSVLGPAVYGYFAVVQQRFKDVRKGLIRRAPFLGVAIVALGCSG